VALEVGRPEALLASLRGADPPVIARVHEGRVLLDPRTLTDQEADLVVAAVRGALESIRARTG
jgi:L-seryl-tRNA(Ser) seleniumtransferase